LLAADNFQMFAPPPGRQIGGHRGQIAKQRHERGSALSGPGHAFAGEGLDVAAGIADGEDAEAAQTASRAGEDADAFEAGGVDLGAKIAMARAENLLDEIGRATAAAARDGIERRGEMVVPRVDANEADVTALAGVHVNLARRCRGRLALERGRGPDERARGDVPAGPVLGSQERSADAVGGDDDGGLNG
jgi:hypothetical protein